MGAIYWAPVYGWFMDNRPLPPSQAAPPATPAEKLGSDVASIKVAVWIMAILMMLTFAWAFMVGVVNSM